MMRYRYALLTLVVACLLLRLVPVHAQAGWQAWLYDPNDLRMTLVSEAGFLQDFVLRVDTGFDLFPQRVAVSHGGSLMAYTIANSSSFASQLLLVRADGSYTASAIPPALTGPSPTILADSLQYKATEFIFDETNSSLALGYSLVDGGWEIGMYSTANLEELHRLRSNDPLLTVLGLPSQAGITPIVQRNQAGNVTFTLILTGTEGAAEYPSYTWNVDSNAVTGDIAYPTLDNDTLAATGEVVMSMSDARLPNASSTFIFFQANSLHVYDPVQNGRYPFYNQQNFSLYSPRFVQGGERVLAAVSDAGGTATWQVIERSGALVGPIPTPGNITSVAGVPDGFVYTTDTFNPGTTTLVFVNTRDGLDAGAPVWTSAPGATPQTMWAGGTGFSSQAALPGWAQLAAPEPGTGAPLGGMSLDAGGGAAIVAPVDLPTTAPVNGGILVIGGQATINTTEGDTLNVRGGPGTSYQVVARLPHGTRVTIIEGPRAGEGFTWWRVRAGSVEGWVVESVEDRGTRLQTLIP